MRLSTVLYNGRFHECLFQTKAFMAVLDSLLAKKEDKSSVPSSPNARKVEKTFQKYLYSQMYSLFIVR